MFSSKGLILFFVFDEFSDDLHFSRRTSEGAKSITEKMNPFILLFPK